MKYSENKEWAEEVNGWVEIDTQDKQKGQLKISRGEAKQSTYTGLADDYLDLGLAKFLRADAIEEVIQAFRKSA